MANWLTRGISKVNQAIRTGFNRAFGGEQPAPRPTGFDWRDRLQPTAPAPTPADYAEEETYEEEYPYEEEYYGDETSIEEPYTPTIIGGEPRGEPLITLYGGEEHFNEPFSQTLTEWMGDATGLSSYELHEEYGLSAYDIIQGLIDEDYDYPGSHYNRRTGEPISGLWEDFRAEYDGDTP